MTPSATPESDGASGAPEEPGAPPESFPADAPPNGAAQPPGLSRVTAPQAVVPFLPAPGRLLAALRSGLFADLPAARRSELRLALLGGSLGRAFLSFFAGSMLASFIERLGLELDYALLNATAFLAAFPQLIIPLILERTGRRRRLFFLARGPARLIWLAIAALPLICPEETMLRGRFWLLFGFLLFHHVNRAGGETLYLSWIDDLVPPERRGRFLALLEGFGSAGWIVIGLVAAYLIDYFRQADWIYAASFGAVAVFGLGEVVCFARLRHPPYRPTGAGVRSLRVLAEPFRSPAFRRIAAVFGLWQFGNMLMWASIPIMMASKNELGLALPKMQWIWVVSAVFSLLSAPVWGWVIDRWGSRTALLAGLPFHATASLYYLFICPERIWPIFGGVITGAIFFNSAVLAQRVLILERTELPSKAVAFGALDVVLGVASVAGMLVAWLAVNAWPHARWPFLGWTISVLQIVTACGALPRLASTALVWRLLPGRTAKRQLTSSSAELK